MHTVRSAPALGTIAERIHFPSNPKHPENALLNVIYLGLFHIEDVCSVIPIFHRVLCFDAICHVNLGTLAPWGLRFAFLVPFATCVTPCGTTAITQTQVAPRYACEALASGHSQMYQKSHLQNCICQFAQEMVLFFGLRKTLHPKLSHQITIPTRLC